MQKDVLISIKGLQFSQDPEAEKVEVITPATFYDKGGNSYVVYDEVMEGMEGATKNVIRIGEEEMNILKRGAVNVQMLFTKNEKNLTSYSTPFGSIMIGIDTSNYQVKREENSMKVHVEYALELNYEHHADCKIDIEVKDKALAKTFFS